MMIKDYLPKLKPNRVILVKGIEYCVTRWDETCLFAKKISHENGKIVLADIESRFLLDSEVDFKIEEWSLSG